MTHIVVMKMRAKTATIAPITQEHFRRCVALAIPGDVFRSRAADQPPGHSIPRTGPDRSVQRRISTRNGPIPQRAKSFGLDANAISGCRFGGGSGCFDAVERC